MLVITKKRFSDDEMCMIMEWFRGIGVSSSWADIYKYSVSNIEIVRHLVLMYGDKGKTNAIPTTIKGLKNVIVKNDDLI